MADELSRSPQRLLLLLPFPPGPEAMHGSGRLLTELVGELAARYELGLLCLRAPAEATTDAAIRAACRFVREVRRHGAGDGLAGQLHLATKILWGTASGRPSWATAFDSGEFRREVRRTLASWRPEIVQAEYHVMAQYLDEARRASVRSVATVYDPGTGAAADRLAAGPPWMRPWLRLERDGWRSFEPDTLDLADVVVAFSDRDRTRLRADGVYADIRVIAPGLWLPPKSAGPQRDGDPVVLFAANFVHPPNLEAARFLARQVFPEVRRRISGARLVLAGSHPPASIRRLADDAIEVTGRLPSLSEQYARAAVVAAPLFSGGGIRVKVIEALAAGKAVVATPLAIEGLAMSGEPCLRIASGPTEFASAIVDLLADPSARRALESRARRWAEEELSWRRTVDAYDRLYRELLRDGRRVDDLGPPSLSVAVSTRDRPDELARCLASLARGERVPDEVVVVDQGEGPATHQRIEAARSAGLVVRYHAQRERGLAVSQNLAVEKASGWVVAVLDDDCVADSRWLLEIERTFGAVDAPDVVTGRVLPLPPAGDRIHPVATRTDPRPRSFSRRAIPWGVGSGNNFALRREWFLRVGGCDERLGPGSPGEGGVDVDLFYQLLRAGARVRYEPACVVFHERQDATGRMARRFPYGHGTGACVALWLRSGDASASWILFRWLLHRARRLVAGALRLDGRTLREEGRMLRGTVRGLGYGWRAPGGRRVRAPS
jgi:glycosyltransferase involved in cell wall biosynthesis/GT2 family glycosyltransferase